MKIIGFFINIFGPEHFFSYDNVKRVKKRRIRDRRLFQFNNNDYKKDKKGNLKLKKYIFSKEEIFYRLPTINFYKN